MPQHGGLTALAVFRLRAFHRSLSKISYNGIDTSITGCNIENCRSISNTNMKQPYLEHEKVKKRDGVR